MPRQFTDTERRILRRLQGDLPDSATPFADIAAEVGADEAQVLALVQELKADGSIRRFGATLRHQKAGYGHNAMVAWRVGHRPDAEAIGQAMAERPEISHCYIRDIKPGWPFDLYTMVHGQGPGDVRRIVDELAEATGLEDHAILESVRELKKTSMTYF